MLFKKPWTVKSNTVLRNSDKKKVMKEFNQTDEKFFSKGTYSTIRSITWNGMPLFIYFYDKDPIFFAFNGDGPYFPSLYMTWLIPQHFPMLFIPEQAFKFLLNGADLMLPGVITNERIKLPWIGRGSPICISLYSEKDNWVKGPVAVGKTLMSTDEMIVSEMKGKGVQILHIYEDELWEDTSTRKNIPMFDADEVFDEINGKSSKKTKEAASDAKEGSSKPLPPTVSEDAQENQDDVLELPPLENVSIESEEEQEDQEEFIRKVFLYALRYKLPEDIKFPIDVGQFYAAYIIKSLPEGRSINLKKTKYKKFSKFLQDINETAGEGEWFVKVVSKKGIDSITEINLQHPEIQSAALIDPLDSSSNSTKLGKVKVADCFTLTEASLNHLKQLFPKRTFKRGDIIQPNELSDLIKTYVTEKCLLKNGNRAELDDTLQSIVKQFTGGAIPVNDIVQKLSAQMTKAYLITAPDGKRSLRKTQLPQIILSTEKRSGNKQVTLVNNLNAFGIDAKEFSQKVQTGSATGATVISVAPNCVGPQVLINGNQINYVVHLLDEYGVQKKFIKGAELGVKQKKAKK